MPSAAGKRPARWKHSDPRMDPHRGIQEDEDLDRGVQTLRTPRARSRTAIRAMAMWGGGGGVRRAAPPSFSSVLSHITGGDRQHAYQNKAVISSLMFKACGDDDHDRGRSQTPEHADRRDLRTAHLGIGAHPPSACPHDPYGDGHFLDGEMVSPAASFFLPVRVLSRLFRRLFLEKLVATPCRRAPAILGAHPNLRTAIPSEYLTPSPTGSNGWSPATPLRRP